MYGPLPMTGFTAPLYAIVGAGMVVAGFCIRLFKKKDA